MLTWLTRCPGCQESPDAGTFPLCQICAQSLVDAPTLCRTCGSSQCPRLDPRACVFPWRAPSGVGSFHARYLLIGPGYRVLRAWKANRGPWLSRRILTDEVPLSVLQLPLDSIVPIPQDPRRSLAMNGSPAYEIACWLARRTVLPVEHSLRLGVHSRTAAPVRQAELTSTDRLTRAFRFAALPQKGKRVLLVDDFITTGRTVRVAAQALRQAGAASVDVFCLGIRPEHPLARVAPVANTRVV